jgi:hypothetical protein
VEKGELYSVIGIVSQYQDEHELLPRYQSDIALWPATLPTTGGDRPSSEGAEAPALKGRSPAGWTPALEGGFVLQRGGLARREFALGEALCYNAVCGETIRY